MSKKVKSLIEKETASRLTGVEAVGVLNPRGIGAIANNQIRRRLREQNLRMTVVKNTMAARATANNPDGPSIITCRTSCHDPPTSAIRASGTARA